MLNETTKGVTGAVNADRLKRSQGGRIEGLVADVYIIECSGLVIAIGSN